MTGEPPPPTRRTPEELIAQLVAAMMAYVFALIDATPLPHAWRKHLKAIFADLFVRLEAKCLAIIEQQRAANALNQPELTTPKSAQQAKPPAPAPTRRQPTKTTPIPRAPQPTSAPTEESPIAEAPHPKRAPALHQPTRAPDRAVAPSSIFTAPSPQKIQKTAFTTPSSHAHFVTS